MTAAGPQIGVQAPLPAPPTPAVDARAAVSVPGGLQGTLHTSMGAMTQDAAGRPVLRMSPRGRAAYQRLHAEHRTKFGKFPGSDDPSSPQPKIVLGQPSFNPFTGKFTDDGDDQPATGGPRAIMRGGM